MINEKLRKIGEKLGVSGKDISDVKRNYWKSYFLYIGAAIVVGAIFFILGCCGGPVHNAANNAGHTVAHNGANHVNGYPYGLVLPGAAAKRNGRIHLLLLGIVAFLLLISVPVFGASILYNVYQRRF